MLETLSYICALEVAGLGSKFDSSQYKHGKQFNNNQCKTGKQKLYSS